MGSSLAWGPRTFQMRRERVWNSATERTARPVRGAYRASPRWATFLVLVGLVMVSSLFMLLSWVSTTLPANTTVACPRQPACEASAPAETQLVLGGDGRTHELKPTP